MSKSRKTTGDNKTTVKPLTKGATLIFPDPIDPKEDKFVIGKSLKHNISFDDLIIPAELADKSVAEVFLFSALDPQAGGKGELSVQANSGGMKYTKDCFELPSDGWVSLVLQKMNMRGAVIQFQVEDYNVITPGIPDYVLKVYKSPSYPEVSWVFPALKSQLSHKKHYISFYIPPEFDTNTDRRVITLQRNFGTWAFYKVKVFMLSAM